MINKLINNYIQKRSFIKKAEKVRKIVVCIPICNEYPTFFKTLTSLSRSANLCDVKIEVICCVNNCISSKQEYKENNLRMLQELKRLSITEFALENNLRLTILDYTSKNNELPDGTGIGTIRKISMDYALCGGAEIIASLDADTIVQENYCECLLKCQKEKISAALTSFTHQINDLLEINNAINKYEQYLIQHSQKLRECETPFFYIALGSTIIVSSQMYCECGGMKNKICGEDFYFLQEIIKTTISKNPKLLSNPIIILPTTVYPDSRISDRVLFGTGKSVENILTNEKEYKVFSDKCYSEIKKFILLIKELILLGQGNLLEQETRNKGIMFYQFLVTDHFFEKWSRNYQNHKLNKDKLLVSFHCLFDGLKIIRVLHYLETLL